jgi:uncharacterized double-CXXCG motif protein
MSRRHFWLRKPSAPRYSGTYLASHRWHLPGTTCPACHATWGSDTESWPCVDLSELDEEDLLAEPRLEEDYSAFERLREKVRPRVPESALLRPGTALGPLVGQARGHFGDLVMQYPWTLLMRQQALEGLRAEGIRGLVGAATALRFRQKDAPRLVELQLEPRGRLHPECLPVPLPARCYRCGRWGIKLPEAPVLDAVTLPEHLDLFRLSDFPTVILGSERFVEAVWRLGYQEVEFHEVPRR